jgi:hypothetical protein
MNVKELTSLRRKPPAAWRDRQRWRRAWMIAALCLIVLGLTATLGFAQQVGTTWEEDPDAGDLARAPAPRAAQAVVGTGPLESITGTILPRIQRPDVDMFKICAGPQFSATTVGGATFDTQLFLFDRNGVGVYANDDSAPGTVPSTLPASHPHGPNIRSEYFLAISEFDRDPVDATVRRESTLIFPSFPFAEVFGRFTDTGPITGWGDGAGAGGDYTISLTDAEFLTSPGRRCAPQPSSLAGAEDIDKDY